MLVPEGTKVTLRTARELNHLTLSQAAKELGLHQDTLLRYEKGRAFPNVKVIKEMEALYGVSYDQIIFLPLDFGLTERN